MAWTALAVEVLVEFQALAERRDDIALATNVAAKLRRSAVGLNGLTRTVVRRKAELGELVLCTLPECATRFVTVRGAKFCSKACRDRGRRVMQPELRPCEHPLCHTTFIARRDSHRFCSSACTMSRARMLRGAVVTRAPKPRGPQLQKPYPRVQQFLRRQAQVPVVALLTGYARKNAVKRARQLAQRASIVCANPLCAVSFVPCHTHTKYCADVCQREHYAQKLRATRKRRWQRAVHGATG